jgi:hypothetical protein
MIGKNIDALPNLFNLFFTNNELWRNIMYDSWNHHIFRLNDNDPAKVKIATNNIMENSENITSKLIRSLLFTINFYTFVFIVGIIFIIVVIIKNNQKIKSLLYTYTKSSNVLQR